MAVNDISPGFVKIYYQAGSSQHVMTIPCKPATTDPTNVGNELYTAIGDVVEFSDAVDGLITLLKPFYNTAVDFTLAELWSKPTPSDNPVFIEAYEIGQQGTSATVTATDGQLVITYRTAGGGIYRQYLMQPVVAMNVVTSAPFPAGTTANLAGYMRSAICPWFGRDGTRIVAPIRAVSKFNDALRKRRLGL